MTDAESFYLILALFYFIECFKFRSPGTVSLANALGSKNSWTPRSELVRLMGIKKWMYLAPLLPWPGLVIIVSNQARPNVSSNISLSPLRIKRLVERYRLHTRALRILSSGIFVYYFILLPNLYFHQRGTTAFFASIGFGYALMFVAAYWMRRSRRYLLPELRNGEIPQLLYTSLLPWHAMRCADELFYEYSRKWNWPSVLASQIDSARSKAQLLRIWREAQYSPDALHSIEQLKPVLDYVKMETELKFDSEENCKFCPCCLSSYELNVLHCPDCQNIELLSHETSNETKEPRRIPEPFAPR